MYSRRSCSIRAARPSAISVSVASSRSMASSCHSARIWEAFRGGIAHSRAVPVTPPAMGRPTTTFWSMDSSRVAAASATATSRVRLHPRGARAVSVGDRGVDLVSNDRTGHYSAGTIRRTPHWRIAGHEQQRAPRARQAATRPEGFERSAPGVVMLGPTRGSPSSRSGSRPRVARGDRAPRSPFPAATRQATTRRTSHSRARP
jgi:hypothetical protein